MASLSRINCALLLLLSIPFWFSSLSFDKVGPGALHQSSPLVAVSGPQRTVTILVEFPDRGNSTSPVAVSTSLVGMNDYYAENSYGKVSFQAETTPSPSSSWYLMPNAMTYYGTDSSSRNVELVHDALQAAYDSGVNLANYRFALVVHAGSDEAITHSANDIHSYTIPGYIFSPQILTRISISTSVVSETDPMGVYAHESGHLLGLPDLYDTTAQIDPTNNFVGYWELMALGEWNPNNGNPLVRPGTYPSHMSAWSKINLGFIPVAQVVTFQSGETGNTTIENIESTTTGMLAAKIPIAYNPDGSLTYYLVEMRAKQGVYDQYLPFPSSYPADAGLLVYKINESIQSGNGSVRLIDAHPGGSLNDAPFGPCVAPCASNNTFSDPANFVKIIITGATPTAYTINVDRTGSPPFLLEINTPSNGVLISIDGINMTSDSSGQLRLTVRYGPHTVYVEARIPVSIGSSSVPVGLSNAFAGWDDGVNSNPRGVSVVADTVLTAIYRITVEPSLTLAVVAVGVLTIAVVAAAIYRRHPKSLEGTAPNAHSGEGLTYGKKTEEIDSFPGNDGLSSDPISEHQKPESTDP